MVNDFVMMKIQHSGVSMDSLARSLNMTKSALVEKVALVDSFNGPFVEKIRYTIDRLRGEEDPIKAYQTSTIREKSFNSENAVRARLNAIEKKREEWVRAQIFKAEQWIKKHKND